MNPTFNSKNERPWLTENHKRRSERAIRIGKETIDQLIKKGVPITYSNVAKWSKEVDFEGKGIHANTIRTNEQLYNYYKQHSKTFKQKGNSKGSEQHKNSDFAIDFRRLKPDRNLEILHRKYMKLSKQELVQRLIQTERYIAENENKWVSSQFESFK
ncbi:hypothetical protein ACIQ1D_07410 [Lysinibacillus xylanilyticus]|uniref:hypothetical protein n=1 Tax=Lysinibacillus xylanilyticus TaxID=582475 RepID=UPI003817950A